MSAAAFRSHELETMEANQLASSARRGQPQRGILELHGVETEYPGSSQQTRLAVRSTSRKAEDDGLLLDIAALRQRQQDYLHAASSLVA